MEKLTVWYPVLFSSRDHSELIMGHFDRKPWRKTMRQRQTGLHPVGYLSRARDLQRGTEYLRVRIIKMNTGRELTGKHQIVLL